MSKPPAAGAAAPTPARSWLHWKGKVWSIGVSAAALDAPAARRAWGTQAVTATSVTVTDSAAASGASPGLRGRVGPIKLKRIFLGQAPDGLIIVLGPAGEAENFTCLGWAEAQLFQFKTWVIQDIGLPTAIVDQATAADSHVAADGGSYYTVRSIRSFHARGTP
jgi:hypothetical protein